jgi:hypothetical protein
MSDLIQQTIRTWNKEATRSGLFQRAETRLS